MNKPLRILSIDGGGTRGLIPATILQCIQQDTGKKPLDLFDLFIGTSTGGIISIGLFFGLETGQLVDLYLNKAEEIFDDSWFDDVRDGFGKKLGSDYSNDNLKKILKNLFADTTLKQVHEKHNPSLGEGELRKILMVPSFDLNPTVKVGDDMKPTNFRAIVFNSFLKRYEKDTLVDLALRTSAGPTYFPIYEKQYIDGGVALNHPAMAAVAFAINDNEFGPDDGETPDYCYPDGLRKGLGLELSELRVLSISCGTSNKNFVPKNDIKTGDWGEIQWVKYLPDLLTESNVQVSEYYVSQVLTKKRYKRLAPTFDDPDIADLKPIFNKIIGLDEVKKDVLEGMQECAKRYYTKHKDAILAFVNQE
ncbi:patatin-like phospholipase family protein [Larkinella sp. C7]|jgi:patatin-like phospholipase/acyl hydrolase|uniref:patatin-like phospholipase family protein n=1 Tax=Larkinella sp. C7 TaxID=2576607 RepID=UPI0011111970|nr:patatin-like phospholipase family protein [Larkinella sp. C7]